MHPVISPRADDPLEALADGLALRRIPTKFIVDANGDAGGSLLVRIRNYPGAGDTIRIRDGHFVDSLGKVLAEADQVDYVAGIVAYRMRTPERFADFIRANRPEPQEQEVTA